MKMRRAKFQCRNTRPTNEIQITLTSSFDPDWAMPPSNSRRSSPGGGHILSRAPPPPRLQQITIQDDVSQPRGFACPGTSGVVVPGRSMGVRIQTYASITQEISIPPKIAEHCRNPTDISCTSIHRLSFHVQSLPFVGAAYGSGRPVCVTSHCPFFRDFRRFPTSKSSDRFSQD